MRVGPVRRRRSAAHELLQEGRPDRDRRLSRRGRLVRRRRRRLVGRQRGRRFPVASGLVVQVPVDVPVTVTGLGADLVAALNPTFGNVTVDP
ncbi:chaplin family protein [Streptomyces bottropensis]|uniref:chaplin family protein n=1 Tax=Streptomyces bottropensis TaxID=42235 RepID=UPI003695EE00